MFDSSSAEQPATQKSIWPKGATFAASCDNRHPNIRYFLVVVSSPDRVNNVMPPMAQVITTRVLTYVCQGRKKKYTVATAAQRVENERY